MKIGIVCAVDRELKPFLPCIQNCKATNKAMLTFYEGTINDMSIVALSSGVCKTNAAIAAQILIDTYRVDIVINAGTAGGMNNDLDVLDTVISTKVAYHDIPENILEGSHPWLKSKYFKADETLIALSRKAVKHLHFINSVHYGMMVTGERFIDGDGRDEIVSVYNPLSVDMETASIAHVCFANNIPFIAVRTVTDTAVNSGIDNYDKNCAAASFISKKVVVRLLMEIKKHKEDTDGNFD